MKKLTAFTVHTTAEGKRCAYMYSVIDAEGNITESNKRANCVLLDADALAAVQSVETFLETRLAAEE
nr:hypothetical protein [uncultured Gemmiger sp.]